MKKSISERIRKDFVFFNKTMKNVEVENFLKCSFFFRSGLYTLSDIGIYGEALFNPLLGIDTEIPMLLWRYYEGKVQKHTGITFDEFKNKYKEEQDKLFVYCTNLEILEKVRMEDIVDELDLKGGEGEQ